MSSASASSELCRACARCCDGSVFHTTALAEEEQKRFRLPVLPQPCPFLKERSCSIHHDGKPQACVEYACPALRGLESGELSLEEAKVTAARMKA